MSGGDCLKVAVTTILKPINHKVKFIKMNQIQIDSLNNKIGYTDGKIINEPGKGYTSQLMKNLYGFGYRATVNGIVHTLYNDKGEKVTSGYSFIDLLYNTAIVLR